MEVETVKMIKKAYQNGYDIIEKFKLMKIEIDVLKKSVLE